MRARHSRQKRRRWNNYMMLGVIAFMLLLNLPTIIKNYLLPEPQPDSVYLLNPQDAVMEINTLEWALKYQGSLWLLTPSLDVPGEELVERWQQVKGSVVSDEMLGQLKAHLPAPETIEVWYDHQEEPQRITLYRFAQFWLLKNYQQQWIAISLDDDYLLPSVSPK
ncbi:MULTISPECIES: hypothetical protein [unclassified Vibrio]|uniref:50S ribosomal protein L33 n=1 Tax=Vibrio sp. HB236076 TaxID=3232307 RepID=A0AB39HE90_9VIBR|nr:hypothetical protein [Vibrio sp. HB161653]MDP5255410.1 hypothetical protein [Vibrio sp. HB161653]